MKWFCTQCAWEGFYKELDHVMFRGHDWERCPSCGAVAFPGEYEHPEGVLTQREQFVVDMASAINDAINNHTGLLRCVTVRLDPNVMDDVQGSLKDLLLRQAEDLQLKRRRAMEKIKEFVGGEEAYIDLQRRWFDSVPAP